MQVTGSTFLVTGAASGLGAATARRLVERGANVIAADRNAEAGEQLAAELGDAARFAAVDVTDTPQVQAAIALARDTFGGLQGAISCAGILHAARVVGREEPYDLQAFRRVIEVNLIGTFNVLRLAASFISTGQPNEDGERGVLINTASIAAEEGQIGQASYAASKAGVAGMTLPIARELARFGIRVMAISPGIFDTSMMAGLEGQARKSLEAQIPFPPRLGRPEEYAAIVQHIIENPVLNGTTIRLDGALRMPAK